MRQCDRGLPEIAVPCARIDHVAATTKQARATCEILAEPQREEEARLLTASATGGGKDHTWENRSRKSTAFILEEAVFHSEFDVAGAVAPTLGRVMGEAERQGRSQLNTLHGTIVEVETGVRVECRTMSSPAVNA